MDRKTQNGRILTMLQLGLRVTALDCSRLNPPILRLSARIWDLRRRGYAIVAQRKHRSSTSWFEYRLDAKVKAEQEFLELTKGMKSSHEIRD